MGNYAKNKGRGGGKFVLLRHDIMDSEAWRALPAKAQALWLYIRRRYNGSNNGQIPLSCREAGALLNVSKNTANKAFKELQEKGFIKVGEYYNFTTKHKKSTRWALTDERYNDKAPSNEWRKWKQEN